MKSLLIGKVEVISFHYFIFPARHQPVPGISYESKFEVAFIMRYRIMTIIGMSGIKYDVRAFKFV